LDTGFAKAVRLLIIKIIRQNHKQIWITGKKYLLRREIMSGEIIRRDENKGFTAVRLVYFILGVLEVMLGFRLMFKLIGANPNSNFVSFIYSTTKGVMVPFDAIFRPATTQGIETKAVLEPSAIIAMIVCALIAWRIAKFIIIVRGNNEEQ